MIRTQLYLPEDLKLELDLLSQKENRPAAQVIRELIRQGLEQTKKRQKRNAGDLLLELAAMAGEGPTDLSENFFDYAYGKKSSYAKRRQR